MKKINILISSLALLAACSDSKLETQVKGFEEKNGTATVEVLKLAEVGVVKGADSLNVLFDRNLTDTGLQPDAMKNWTPDSMIQHYQKLLTYYKASIGAFEYSATTKVKPDVETKYKEMAARYRKEMTDDSSRLQKLLFFNANKDSVLALRYEALLRTKEEGSTAAPQEVNKIVVVAKDRSMVISSAPKN